MLIISNKDKNITVQYLSPEWKILRLIPDRDAKEKIQIGNSLFVEKDICHFQASLSGRCPLFLRGFAPLYFFLR